MTEPPAFLLRRGLPKALQAQAAALYWDAFAAKLARVLGPRDRALAYLAEALRGEHALAAVSVDGRLLGLAGMQTGAGGLSGGTQAGLAAVYGRFGAAWRQAALMALAQDPEPGLLHLDALCVAGDMQGRGIGRGLLEAVCAEARRLGRHGVRLEVAAGNPGARALYRRAGFVETGRRRLGPLRLVFGMSGVIVMERVLVEQPRDPCEQHEGAGGAGVGKGHDLGILRS